VTKVTTHAVNHMILGECPVHLSHDYKQLLYNFSLHFLCIECKPGRYRSGPKGMQYGWKHTRGLYSEFTSQMWWDDKNLEQTPQQSQKPLHPVYC